MVQLVVSKRLIREDLLDAQANLDWVSNRLPQLARRLETWLEENVTLKIRNVPPPATFNPIIAFEKEILPVVFSVEVGAYINTLRSSLDILAMALVRRHDLKFPERRVYFPIAESEDALLKTGTELLKAFSPEDQEKVMSLKPYRKGNPMLWAMHQLDIVRKHRRLLDVQIRPARFRMIGGLTPSDFAPLNGEPFQVGAETVIGLIRKGVQTPMMQSSFYVAINEPDTIETQPVVLTLNQLVETVTNIIKLFDS